MNWLANILPGVKRGGKKAQARAVPEGVWEKCRQCQATVYSPEKIKNLWVCPHCAHHDRIDALQRAQILFDETPPPQELAANLRPTDFLSFRDIKPYGERLQQEQKQNAARESARAFAGNLQGRRVVAVIFDFHFMGGSLGGVAGERFARAAEAAAAEGAPFLVFSSSGGARMQEGIASLLQMAKTVSALAKLEALRLPFVSVLTDPTTGGVAASFALLGDINMAEPGATIGFAGRRVIQETVREELPAGFQRSEFLQDKGAIDIIVDRREMRDKLGALLNMLAPPKTNN